MLDFKKDVGLWHGILTVRSQNSATFISCLLFPSKQQVVDQASLDVLAPPFLLAIVGYCVCAQRNIFFGHLLQSVMNMMHVISVPYSLMKVNPLSWIQKVCQYKGQMVPHPS